MPTKIEWCDETRNPVVGCTKRSPGCDNCYAERIAARLAKNPNPKIAAKYAGLVDERGQWTGRINVDLTVFDHLPKKGSAIFMASMGDLFHEVVPKSFYPELFAAIRNRPEHRFLLLTKRADRMRVEAGMAQFSMGFAWPLKNLWMGVTVCNQAEADTKIPVLLATPAAHRFVSIEPMLGPVDLTLFLDQTPFQCTECGHREWNSACQCPGCGYVDKTGDGYCPECQVGFLNNEICICSICDGDTKSPSTSLDWVIVGGETGPKARPMHLDWVRGLRDQCAAAGVPFFLKSWGEWLPWSHFIGAGVYDDEEITRYLTMEWDGEEWDDVGYPMWDQAADMDCDDAVGRVGRNKSGRRLDGVEHNERPW